MRPILTPAAAPRPVLAPPVRSSRPFSPLAVLHVVALVAQLLDHHDPGRLAFALGCALVLLVVAELRP